MLKLYEQLLGAQLNSRCFVDKMQLYCEKMVKNESFKVLPIVSYNYTAGGVGLPISAFPGRFQRVWQLEAERCHVVESLFDALLVLWPFLRSARLKRINRVRYSSQLWSRSVSTAHNK